MVPHHFGACQTSIKCLAVCMQDNVPAAYGACVLSPDPHLTNQKSTCACRDSGLELDICIALLGLLTLYGVTPTGYNTK